MQNNSKKDLQGEIEALRAQIAEEGQNKKRGRQGAEQTPDDKVQSKAGGGIPRLLSPDLSGWGHRFVLQLFPWAMLMGIYWFFGPLSLIQQSSRADIGFDMLVALPWYLGAFVLLTLAGAALCALLRDRHFQRVLVAVFILGVLSYLQALLLNPNTGLLDGKTIDWSEYIVETVLGTVVWVVFATGIAFACFKLKANKYKLIAGVSALLLVMQVAGFVAGVADAVNERKDTRFVFGAEEQLVVSENENVILIVLDSFSHRAVKEVNAAYPGAFDFLHDFTDYTNYAPCYYATFPEMAHVLTGAEYAPDMTWREFQTGAWTSEKATLFFSTLKEQGYTRRFLSTEGILAPSKEILADVADNVEDVSVRMVPSETFKQVAKLTLFRYAPTVSKPLFFVTPNDFMDVYEGTVGGSGRAADIRIHENDGLETDKWNGLGEAFYDVICDRPLDTAAGDLFLYMHFNGSHVPYVMDENMNMPGEETDIVRQSRGYLRLCEQYLERMKELGVYDDATIIVMADHGDQIYKDSPLSAGALMYVKLPGESHDVSPVNDIAVTDESVLPTLMWAVDKDVSAQLGTPFHEVKEGDNAVRTIRRMEFPGGGRALFYVFHYTEHINELADLTEPDEVEELPDRFW